jgi:hypothetical protein
MIRAAQSVADQVAQSIVLRPGRCSNACRFLRLDRASHSQAINEGLTQTKIRGEVYFKVDGWVTSAVPSVTRCYLEKPTSTKVTSIAFLYCYNLRLQSRGFWIVDLKSNAVEVLRPVRLVPSVSTSAATITTANTT